MKNQEGMKSLTRVTDYTWHHEGAGAWNAC